MHGNSAAAHSRSLMVDVWGELGRRVIAVPEHSEKKRKTDRKKNWRVLGSATRR